MVDKEEPMGVQFLLFVIAVLQFAVFWELCKINSQLKKSVPAPLRTTAGGEVNDKVTAKAVG
jgi:hypothetical protein